MRKLATIAFIENIQPHHNADSLEIATVRGWQTIVKKQEFQIGDYCVYIEIDSVLPDKPEFEFMRDRKFRVRTIRLRGEISQGLVFPIYILPTDNYNVGDDVTEVMGVTLYSPPIPACLAGQARGNFPSYIPKTDCERIQNHKWILEKLKDIEWIATEKANGSSTTIFWSHADELLHVCSRNWDMQDSESNAYWRAVHALGLEKTMKGSNYALQGELLGPKIQGNWYNLPDYVLLIFDVYDIVNRKYLDFMAYREYCEGLNLMMVPVQYRSKLRSFNPPPGESLPASPFESLDQVLSDAEGESDIHQGSEREGLVWRPLMEMQEKKLGRVAFKAISNKFLLAM